MASNRKTVRQAFADLLETALASLAQKVYDYRVGDFGNQSPVVVASNAGSRRERISFQGSKVTTYLQVDVFVLYSDEGSWGEDDAEERLDDIEAAIAGVLDGNQQTANWYAVSQEGRSERIDVQLGGAEYIREVITMAVESLG